MLFCSKAAVVVDLSTPAVFLSPVSSSSSAPPGRFCDIPLRQTKAALVSSLLHLYSSWDFQESLPSNATPGYLHSLLSYSFIPIQGDATASIPLEASREDYELGLL